MNRLLLLSTPLILVACLHTGDVPSPTATFQPLDEWAEDEPGVDAQGMAEADTINVELDEEPVDSVPNVSVDPARQLVEEIVQPASLREARVQRRRISLAPWEAADTISVNFLNTPMEDVAAAFSTRTQRTILLGEGVSGREITADIHRQPWHIALETLLAANGLEPEQDPDTWMITVRSAESARDMEEQRRPTPEVFRINYGEADEIAGVLNEILGDRAYITQSQSTNSLLVSGSDEVLQEVEGLLDELDILPTLVSIEVQILTLATQQMRSLGLSFTVEDPDRPFGGGDMGAEAQGAGGFGGGAMTPPNLSGQSQVMIEPSGIHMNHPLLLLNRKSNASFSTFIERAISGTPYSFTSFVDAMHGASLAEVHARPTATTLSEKPVQLRAGDAWNVPTQGIVGGGQQQGGAQGGGGAVAGGRERIEVGVTLDVTPSVLPNGNIRLRVNAERSGGSLGPDGTVTESFQEGDWEVIVGDGETHVLGGLMLTEESTGRTGVPFLSDLPIVGRAFSKEQTISSEHELVFMITPRILQQEIGSAR